MMREIVCTAFVVCSVESTRWPVSAAFMAVSIVVTSRISPIITTSGSSRSADFRPWSKLDVSLPTSRCVIEQLTSRCRNSIGFSSVMM